MTMCTMCFARTKGEINDAFLSRQEMPDDTHVMTNLSLEDLSNHYSCCRCGATWRRHADGFELLAPVYEAE